MVSRKALPRGSEGSRPEGGKGQDSFKIVLRK
jgi:hypothetical protein